MVTRTPHPLRKEELLYIIKIFYIVTKQVEPGKPEVVNKNEVAKNMENEEYRLRVMMIKKKHKGLYKSMMKSRKRRENQAKQLERKRKVIDEQTAVQSSAKKKKKSGKTA